MMAGSVEDGVFDVEAQELLLDSAGPNDARRRLQRTIWTIRYVIRFVGAYPAVHRISSDDHRILISQDSIIVAAPELSSHEDTFNHHSDSGRYQNSINIELQQIQKQNITEIVKNKNLHDLHNFGGIEGVAEALNTDLENGISTPQQTSQSHPTQLNHFLLTFIQSLLEASNNPTILLLICAAILSLVLGIREDAMHDFGWLNGAVLLSNIFIIIIVTTMHKCWKKWSDKKLENCWHSKLGTTKKVLTVRGGNNHHVYEADLEVGDIVILRKGDQVPADGLFVTRTRDHQLLELDDGSVKFIIVDESNPFLFYGSRVVNGHAKMLVTSTRMETVWGEMMSHAISEEKDCKLLFESYLHNLSTCVHISGLLISILIIIVLILRFKKGKFDDESGYRPDARGEPTRLKTIIDAVIGIITGTKATSRVLTTLSVSLLGITEGVPFVISFATILWSRKKLADKATERDNLACFNMASVTVICTDKFGGLTEHGKAIDKFFVGEDIVSESSVVGSQVLEGLCDGIGTQFLIPPNDCEPASLALPEVISWAVANLGLKREYVIEQCKMISYIGLNPLQERCQVLIVKNGSEGYLHCNGLPSDILALCSHHYDINGGIQEIDARKRSMLEGTIYDILAEEARVIAYAYKQVDPEASSVDEPNNFVFLAMISLKDVMIEDTKEAVSAMMEDGVRTILVSGDDVSVLEPIGRNCGLIAPGSDDHLVTTGEEFRNWSDEERMDKLDKLCIIGNCLPTDKILLIKCLQQNGHVVALLAQRTIDATALKLADVGLTFGTWSSEVARECCDITIWDFNCFGFMVYVIKSGRYFQDNVRKFVQLQLVFTISSSLINFTTTVCFGDAPITPVQLFWLNLVVALVGGLALLTGTSMQRVLISTVPIQSFAKLITKAMWRNIAIQASYQISIFVTLQHKGQVILGVSGEGRIKSIIYNGFFLCQLFNKFIAREPQKKNIFSGLFRNNFLFWVALAIFVICQAVFGMAERGLGSSPCLSFKLWGACLLIGLVSLLLDWAGKSASDFYCSLVSEQGGIWRLNPIRSLFSAYEPSFRLFNLLNS